MRRLPLACSSHVLEPARAPRPLRAAIGLVLVVASLLGAASGAAAQDDGTPAETDAGFVRVFEVSGLLDPVVAAAIEHAIDSAENDGARALVLQLDSAQAVVSDERLNELATRFSDATVSIAVWVGPSGSVAHGKVAQLVGLADDVGVAIGSTLGGTGPQVLDADRFGQVWGDNQALLADTEINWIQAIEKGIVACERVSVDELGGALSEEESLARCANPTIGDFLVSLDEVESRVVDTDGIPRRSLVTRTFFGGLGLPDQLMHTVSSPPVAYLLFIIGLALLVFEFFSIGVGIAGVIGAVMVALGGYGLVVLPVRTWAIVVLLLSMVAFSVDIQSAVPRAWTAIGMVMFVVGTLALYPQSDVAMSWIPMVVAAVGMGIVMYRGMPIMVRGRFATTEVWRDFLIDEQGQVVATGPRLEVEVRGARWPASSEQDLAHGAAVTVTAAAGSVLTVEATA